MIARWIIFGLLLGIYPPVIGQITLQNSDRLDSLYSALDTAGSNYYRIQLTDEILRLVDTAAASPKLYEIYGIRGRALFQAGNYHQALISQQAASRIAHQLQDSFLIAQSSYSIGSIQYIREQYKYAQQHFEQAAGIFGRLDSVRWLAYAKNGFGLLAREQGQWEQALGYYREAYDLLVNNGFEGLSSIPLNNIGDIYFLQEKYKASLEAFQKSLTLALRLRRSSDIATAYLNIGQSHRELSNYDQAVRDIRRGLDLARKEGLKPVEALGLKDLSETFERIDQPDSALLYLDLYLELQDSLKQAETNARIEELYVVYETQKAREEAALQKQEIEDLKKERQLDHLSDYFIITLLILALMLSSFLIIRNRMKRKLAESQLRNQKLEAQQIRRELEGKQKDLTNLALEIARKNELFSKTNEALTEIDRDSLPPEQQKKIRQLIQYNVNQLRINEDLKELLLNIEQVNADFFEKLNELTPDLTPSEKQLCALLRLNLSNKEIAAIRNISPKSVEMARYRLRKKLPIEAGDDIYTFIQNI
ncbi:tetratricopeptide repeat protein [Flavilitoribacter nigricans]|uniref:HTH luxR-type domain-containing protein n=1 Tax=Flavilitoribacter nigricans (strain ATCC 23147 / DSM 23189 / NBRC 102662 / NCIMB 1420 / SS-2) TaxID=1122177 RepID=A0A2D0NIJ2_FLAN2|nr:tetratricopeptide repeat protein [Flavilitoribacter nigricans]PHN07573.1 hypothetical protein CRP01_05585 [Flavilitoribacter nigricans DSM 23189 = NBRC 102662]